MQLVDGSSDVHVVGCSVSSVYYSYFLAPLIFSAGPLASKLAVRPFTDPSHLPAIFSLLPAGVRKGLV